MTLLTPRTLLVAFGLLEVLLPERIVRWGERLAFENPDEGILRPWTLPIARLEGIAFVWLVLRGSIPSPFRKGFVVIGLPAVLSPKPFVTGALGVAYENPDDLKLRPWVVPFTRVLGVASFAVVLFSGRVDAPTNADRSATPVSDRTDS
ncbi:hypothetical protein [Halomontanus rarus]|uniref:hypothetical protein n=1 Tax=Halomontanus rarus TaxID=3034020 RepID=UPI001A9833CD